MSQKDISVVIPDEHFDVVGILEDSKLEFLGRDDRSCYYVVLSQEGNSDSPFRLLLGQPSRLREAKINDHNISKRGTYRLDYEFRNKNGVLTFSHPPDRDHNYYGGRGMNLETLVVD